MEDTLTNLMKYAQGVAHMWDTHEIGLAKQERALVEKLEVCRQKHDQSNQVKDIYLPSKEHWKLWKCVSIVEG